MSTQYPHKECARAGYSMLEVLLASLILSLAAIAVMHGLASGNKDLHTIERTIISARVSGLIAEEIILEPNASRELLFDGYSQNAGELTDALDELLPTIAQQSSRSVELFDRTISVQFGSITSVDCHEYVINAQEHSGKSESYRVRIPMTVTP